MERYLVYDPGCAVCHELGETVRDVARQKLELLPIREAKALALLDRAYPHGWEPVPYVIFADAKRVRAWSGPAAALRLATTVGPHGAWRIWTAARRQGIYLPPVRAGVTRRHFLQVSAGLVATLASVGLFPHKAAAAVCDRCNYYYAGCVAVSVCGYPPQAFYASQYDCYDGTTYCKTVYSNYACGYCP